MFSMGSVICVVGGAYKAPCPKVLSYSFTESYDSESCYNFAVGVPYGAPALTGNMLCLNGENQFLSVGFCMHASLSKTCSQDSRRIIDYSQDRNKML